MRCLVHAHTKRLILLFRHAKTIPCYTLSPMSVCSASRGGKTQHTQSPEGRSHTTVSITQEGSVGLYRHFYSLWVNPLPFPKYYRTITATAISSLPARVFCPHLSYPNQTHSLCSARPRRNAPSSTNTLPTKLCDSRLSRTASHRPNTSPVRFA